MHQSTRHAGRNPYLVGTILAHFFLHFKHSVARCGDSVNAGFLDVKEIAIIIGAVGVACCHAEPFAGRGRGVFGRKFHCSDSAFFGNRFAFGDAHVFQTSAVYVRVVLDTE